MAKGVMRIDAELEGLSRNWRDSLAHALVHFSDLRSSDYGFHNRKWLVLSVHHAAEVFSNYLVRRADSAYPPRGRYPSLIRTLSLMREHDVWATLTAGEQRVATEFLPPLVEMRNQLMHGPAPADIDVSQAALTALALLILVKRQTNASTKEFFHRRGLPDRRQRDPKLEILHNPLYLGFMRSVACFTIAASSVADRIRVN